MQGIVAALLLPLLFTGAGAMRLNKINNAELFEAANGEAELEEAEVAEAEFFLTATRSKTLEVELVGRKTGKEANEPKVRLLQLGNKEAVEQAGHYAQTVMKFAEMAGYEYALHKLPKFSYAYQYTAQKPLVF